MYKTLIEIIQAVTFNGQATSEKAILQLFDSKPEYIHNTDYITPDQFINDADWSYINEIQTEQLDELNGEFIELESGNTYNYNGSASNDILYNIFEDVKNDKKYVAIAFHIGTQDIRYGYTDSIIYEIDDAYDVYTLLGSLFTFDTIEHNGKEYAIDYRLDSEYLEISELENGGQIEVFASIDDLDEIKKEIDESGI